MWHVKSQAFSRTVVLSESAVVGVSEVGSFNKPGHRFLLVSSPLFNEEANNRALFPPQHLSIPLAPHDSTHISLLLPPGVSRTEIMWSSQDFVPVYKAASFFFFSFFFCRLSSGFSFEDCFCLPVRYYLLCSMTMSFPDKDFEQVKWSVAPNGG